jgi:hypothetical protein
MITPQVERRIRDLGRQFAAYAKTQNLELLGSDAGVFFRINDSHRFCVRPVGIDRFYRSVELADHEAYFLETPGDLDPTSFFEGVLQRCFAALRSNMVPMIRLPDPAPLPTAPQKGVYEAVPHRGYTPPSAPAEPQRASFREEEPERRSRVQDDDGPIGIIEVIESILSNDSGGSGYDGGGGDSGGGGASGDW